MRAHLDIGLRYVKMSKTIPPHHSHRISRRSEIRRDRSYLLVVLPLDHRCIIRLFTSKPVSFSCSPLGAKATTYCCGSMHTSSPPKLNCQHTRTQRAARDGSMSSYPTISTRGSCGWATSRTLEEESQPSQRSCPIFATACTCERNPTGIMM